MYLLVLITSLALFLIFGLGYGASLTDRLGVTLVHPFFNNRFNFGPRNERSQNHQFFTSNTSSCNSLIGDHERQRVVQSLELRRASIGSNRENNSQNGLRDEANYSENMLDHSHDSFTKDVREKELTSYGKFHQPITAQRSYTGVRNESNTEIILRALRSTMQQNAEDSSVKKSLSKTFDTPNQEELARNR